MKNTKLITAVKISITLIAIGVISRQVDLQSVGRVLLQFPFSGALIIFGCLAAGLVISTLKWQAILKGLGRSNDFTPLARLFWVGLFFNTFLPGRTGGDVVRACGLAATDNNRLRSFASVIVDRGLNLLALVLICFIATFVDTRIPGEIVTVVRSLALISFSVTVGALSLSRWYMRLLPDKVQQLLRALDTGSWNPRRIATVVGLAIGFQMLVVIINLVAARGLGMPISGAALFVAIPITAIITALPISINGFGVREAAYVTTLAYLGIEPEVAVALSISVTALMVAWSLGGGAVFALSSFVPNEPDVIGQPNGS